MKLMFRTAVASDNLDLEILINSAYRGESSRIGWTTEAELLDGLRTDAQDLLSHIGLEDKNLLLGFDEQNKLQGCVYLEKRGENCYLGMLSVSPPSQGAGIGKQLMEVAEKFARESYGANRMEMTVITERHELISWYERRGYHRTGRHVPFPVHPKFGVLKVAHLEMEILEKDL